MTLKEFGTSWPILNKQAKTFQLPWLEGFAARSRDPFRVLISCILSLRTQDKTTASAAERLFRLASTPEAVLSLSGKTIEKAIYPVGFYRVKAGTIKDISREITEKYGSQVPDTLEGLLTLKGVGRKTANLVLTRGFNKYGICVDTHVHRIINRWGLIATNKPDETELTLRRILPRKYWKDLNAVLVAFGQHICQPVSPFCSKCTIRKYCKRRNVEKHR
jgi:endonuclease-3